MIGGIIIIITLLYVFYKQITRVVEYAPMTTEGFAVPEEQTGLNAPHDIKMEIGRNAQLSVKRGDGGYGAINGLATSVLAVNRDVSKVPTSYGPDYPPTLGSSLTVDPPVGDPTNSVQNATLTKGKKLFDNFMPYEYKPVEPKYPDDCYSAYWF
jgi:hypothetical protein